MAEIVDLAVFELLSLTIIPVLHRTIVSGDPAVDFRLLSAVRADSLLTDQVTVILTYRVGRAQGVVGEPVVFRNLANQVCGGLPVRELFTQERVEHGSGGVQRLQFILHIQCGEDVFAVAHRQVAGVGVVRSTVHVRCDDVRILLLIMLSETIGSGFSRSSFQIKQVAILLLIVAQTIPHMIQDVLSELLSFLMSHVLADPLCVQTSFIHTDQADSAEVVGEGSEVTAGVRIQTVFHQLGDDLSFGIKAAGRNVHQLVQAAIEVSLISSLICQTRHIDGHNTDRTGGFTRAEESTALLTKLAQIQAEAAAHAANITGLHIGVDVVAEVGSTVLCGHLKQKTIVLCIRPVEVSGDGVGGDRILEATPIGVALDHDLNEGFIDHVHFLLAVAISEIHFLSTDNRRQVHHVRRTYPVKGNIGKRSLRAPAARRIHTEHEGLHALFNFLLGQVVHADKRSQIGIETGERLGTGPFILHDTQEVDHLVAQSAQMARRVACNLSRNTAQTFHQELFQTPSGAVSGQHAQVVNVDSRVPMGVGHLIIIDFAQPVAGGDSAGVGQDQAANRVVDGRVLFYTPVTSLQIAIDCVGVIEERLTRVPDFFALFTVQDICLGNIREAGFGQRGFNGILNILNSDVPVMEPRLEDFRAGDAQSNKFQDLFTGGFIARLKSFSNRNSDFLQVKRDDFAITFDHVFDLVHYNYLLSNVHILYHNYDFDYHKRLHLV